MIESPTKSAFFFLQKVLFFSSKSACFALWFFFFGKLLCEDWNCIFCCVWVLCIVFEFTCIYCIPDKLLILLRFEAAWLVPWQYIFSNKSSLPLLPFVRIICGIWEITHEEQLVVHSIFRKYSALQETPELSQSSEKSPDKVVLGWKLRETHGTKMALCWKQTDFEKEQERFRQPFFGLCEQCCRSIATAREDKSMHVSLLSRWVAELIALPRPFVVCTVGWCETAPFLGVAFMLQNVSGQWWCSSVKVDIE